MRRVFGFLLRWVACSVALWLVVELFGSYDPAPTSTIVLTFMLAGLVFSLINMVVRPIVTMLAIPFVIATVGLFTIVINGLMIWLTVALVPNIHMSFGWAIVSSLIVGVINYLMNSLVVEE